MSIRVPAVGRADAKIMLVGEAPGAEEERLGIPFCGSSGSELTRMLNDAGIERADCFITNACKYRPPMNEIEPWVPKTKKGQAVYSTQVHGVGVHPRVAEGWTDLCYEIHAVRPNLIVGLGNTPLWILTQNRGILNWRGSLLQIEVPSPKGGAPYTCKFIPTIHPAAILREWGLRAYAVFDLKRARREMGDSFYVPPAYNFIIRPSFETALRTLEDLSHKDVLSVDVETGRGADAQISCIGFAWSDTDAICIPFHSEDARIHYWAEWQELELIKRIRAILKDPTKTFIGQNFLYDCQYFAKQWGVIPSKVLDTMLMQHVLLPGLPKSLGFISSLHCKNHIYWKEEGKSKEKGWSAEAFWSYNCKDACATYEAAFSLKRSIQSAGLLPVMEFQLSLFRPVLKMMLRGVRVDLARREKLRQDLFDAIVQREIWLTKVCGHPLNPKSPKQMAAFFYTDLGIPAMKNRKTGQPTLNDEALQRIKVKEPLWRQIIDCILELRSLNVFLSTFIEAPLDTDNRMRCSFNITGTKTFRFSSSENAFGSGLNLQTIPFGREQ
jgi:uracil-DNA glycosylase